MGQEKYPAVPPKLTIKNCPLCLVLTYKLYCNGYIPSVATRDNTFDRPHKSIRFNVHYCHHTIGSSL